MEKIKIGFDAGILWNIIDEKGEIKISELKTISKLDIKDIYLALGWLARENKIHLFEKNKELNVCLIS